MAVAHFPLISISIEREEIDVATLSPTRAPDEKWRHVDKNGHGHFWDGGDLPTLEWVVTGTIVVGDEYESDEIDVGEHRCLICHEKVEPGMKIEYGPRSVPGRTIVTVTVNGEKFELSQDEYASSVDKWAEAMRAIRT